MTGKFKFLGSAQQVNHNGKELKKDEEVELGLNQYIELSGSFEPVDDNARSMVDQLKAGPTIPKNLPAHERRGMLEQRRDALQKSLDAINTELSQLDQKPAKKNSDSPKKEQSQ